MSPTLSSLVAALELMGHHLWQSTIVALGAGLLALALRKNRAQVRYWLWLTASIKFLVPFAALVAFGAQFGWRLPVSVERASALTVAIAAGPFSPFEPGAVSIAGLPLLHVHPDPSGGAAMAGLPVLLLAAWLAGLATVLLVWCVRWRRVASLARRGDVVHEGRERDALRRLEKTNGMRRPIALVTSAAAIEPGVFGLIRPVLLWPPQISERLTDAQIQAILAHEVAHVRRRDNLAAAVHTVVQAVFWFHPLVWWIGARLVDERERACDAEVVRLGHDPQVYAESIVRSCQFSVRSPLGCVSGVTGSDLRRRIERIMKNDAEMRLGPWRKALLAAGGLALAAPVVVGILAAPRLGAQSASVDDGGRRGYTGARAWKMVFDHPNSQLSIIGYTGRDLIRFASQLPGSRVVGGPEWMDTETFDIVAPVDRVPTADEMPAVVRGVLEERFGLTTHQETRNFPVYALRLARSDGSLGPNLRPSSSDCFDAEAWRAAGSPRSPLPLGQRHPVCGDWENHSSHGSVSMGSQGSASSVTMAQFASIIPRLAPPLFKGRDVVDRTGLTGTWDVDLDGFGLAFALMGQYPATALLLEPLGFPSLPTALHEQLGLKLANDMAPQDVIIIDRFERAGVGPREQ